MSQTSGCFFHIKPDATDALCFHEKSPSKQSDTASNMAPRTIAERTFTWEGIKITAPGGSLSDLIRPQPRFIWWLFQRTSNRIPQQVYRKLRSCLTEVFVGYLTEAKQCSLLSFREADEAKRVWRTSGDWKRLENEMSSFGPPTQRLAVRLSENVDPKATSYSALPEMLNSLSCDRVNGFKPFRLPSGNEQPQIPNNHELFCNRVDGSKAVGLPSDHAAREQSQIPNHQNLAMILGSLPPNVAQLPAPSRYIPTLKRSNPSTSVDSHVPYKRVRFETDVTGSAFASTAGSTSDSTLTYLSSSTPSPTTPPPTVYCSFNTLSTEKASKLWLNYHLQSVLDAHPPSMPKDPQFGHAVDCARPYLLSLKTRLDCLLVMERERTGGGNDAETDTQNMQKDGLTVKEMREVVRDAEVDAVIAIESKAVDRNTDGESTKQDVQRSDWMMKELEKAAKDLDTVWGCLGMIKKDEEYDNGFLD